MTAVEYVMMYRNTANVELQNFMLALLDALAKLINDLDLTETK